MGVLRRGLRHWRYQRLLRPELHQLDSVGKEQVRELAGLLDRRYLLTVQAHTLASARKLLRTIAGHPHRPRRRTVCPGICPYRGSTLLCDFRTLMGGTGVKLPTFLTPLGMILAITTLLVVAGLLYTDGHRVFSPGELSTANKTGAIYGGVSSHAALVTDCAACHAAPWERTTMAQRCLDCHTEHAAQFTNPAKLHSTPQFQNCRDCHVEHRGTLPISRWSGNFPVNHDLFGFSLVRHQTKPDNQPFACTDCHTESLNRFAAETCVECHQQNESRVSPSSTLPTMATTARHATMALTAFLRSRFRP